MAVDLTILIANIGQLDRLRPCLNSIFEMPSGKTSVRVIVGFNFQGDSTAPQAIAREFPQVEQLRASAKLGFCRAYNQLIARSSSRYVLLLDDDTVLRPGAIDVMVRFMDTHQDVGIAGCRLVNPDGSYQKSTALMCGFATEIISIFRPGAIWRDGVDKSVADWRTVGWLGSAFLIVRAVVIEQVGVFDEFFYMTQHEADWCLRISRAGWKVAYVPEAEVMHIGGPTSVQPGVKTYNNLVRNHINRYYFFRKHYGTAALQALRPIMSLGALLRLVNYGAAWIFCRNGGPKPVPNLLPTGKLCFSAWQRAPTLFRTSCGERARFWASPSSEAFPDDSGAALEFVMPDGETNGERQTSMTQS